jgi:glycosyltransferase involved in cell wall biosynthesis
MKVAILANAFPPSPGGGVMSAHDHLMRLLRADGAQVRGFSYLDAAGDGQSPEIVRRRLAPGFERAVLTAARMWFRVADRGAIAYQLGDTLVSALGARRLAAALAEFDPDAVVVPDHGAPSLLLSLPSRTRVVLVAHHNPLRFLDEPLFGRHSRGDAEAATALERRALRRVDRVVAPSSYMAGVFRETYGDAWPIEVIPNLIAPDTLTGDAAPLRAQMGLPDDCPVVYIPSAGSKYKGGRYVGEIVRRLAAAASGPIGFFLSGKLGPELQRELAHLPTQARVWAPGFLDQRANLAHVRACSFTVSPTLIENFSMALLESIHAGVPVVTFAVGGNPELVADGASGLLAPVGDIEALMAAALRLLDPVQLAQLRASTPFAAERFAPARWLPRWRAILGG